MSKGSAAVTRGRIRSATPLSPIAVFAAKSHGNESWTALRYDAVFASTVVGRDRILHDRSCAFLGVFHGAAGVTAFDEIHRQRVQSIEGGDL